MRYLLPLLVLLAVPVQAQTEPSARLKDLIVLDGAAPIQVIGYGLVVGLDRTGDRARGTSGAPYTVQSIGNMLQRFGITVDPARLGARNAAAVMVTATLDPFSGPGSRLDVTVSALGDARSLAGGVLLQTPLLDPLSETVFAMAQGPVSTGTLLASASGTSARTGPTNTGRVPGGGLITTAPPLTLGTGMARLFLRNPDFTNAAAIAETVNGAFPGAATAVHAGLVQVTIPPDGGLTGLMAALEALEVEVDVPARIVMNERTGTVVAGGDVRISGAMITYGGLMISTQTDVAVSQPNAFSNGQTVATPVGSTNIDQQPAQSVVLPPNADVAQLAAALNDLGLTSRDVIAVFQALSRAGALQGELIIL